MPEQKALVSVIIPVYNVEKYLKECVDSVLNQSYANLEIILVDDGSTDGSKTICDEYAVVDSRVKVFHRTNHGLSATRNFGMENAAGEYIYFLDSDDYIVTETIEKTVEIIEKNGCDSVFFDADSFSDISPNSEIEQRYIRTHGYPICSGREMFRLLSHNKEFHSCVCYFLFRKSFLCDCELSFSEDMVFEDMLFTYQVYMLANKMAYTPHSLYKRRYRQGSITMSGVSPYKYESAKKVYESVRDFTYSRPELLSCECCKYITRCASNALNYYRMLTAADKHTHKESFQELKADILSNKGFGSTALRMDCHGKLFWFIYKAYEKTVRKLFRK